MPTTHHQASPCTIHNIHITYRVTSYDSYTVNSNGEPVDLIDEAVEDSDELGRPYFCRIDQTEFETWDEVKLHLQPTTLRRQG